MLKGLGFWHRNRVSDTAPAGIWFFCRKKGGLRFRRFRINFSLLRESCLNDFSVIYGGCPG